MSQVNNAERIFDWAQQVQLVGFVQMINKKFAGLVLYDKRDAQAVVKVVDSLLEELTHIEGVTDIGLGVPLITVKESTQRQDGATSERERIIKLLEELKSEFYTFDEINRFVAVALKRINND